jgi:trans-2,3-dihydro-3-hydroxyanthranilate isomerase
MSRRYRILDVFTDRMLAGNPLAVVLDSQGLDDAAMLKIAGEFNLSETVFVRPPEDHRHLAAIRIFTRATELSFAGHPTVGTAFLLGLEHGIEDFALEEKVGVVPCTVRTTGKSSGEARFALPRLPQPLGPVMDAATLAAALGLDADDIGWGAHRPSNFSAGTEFTFVPVRDLAAVARVDARPEHWRAAFGDGSHAAAFIYTRGGVEPGASYHARVLAPNLGIREDPATGSAAAAFAGVVQQFERPADGEHRVVIEQGYEMGRPSRITVTMTIDRGVISRASVGGSVVLIASGDLYV